MAAVDFTIIPAEEHIVHKETYTAFNIIMLMNAIKYRKYINCFFVEVLYIESENMQKIFQYSYIVTHNF